MDRGFVAKAAITVDATVAEVWDALVNPDIVKRYMFGATVVSDWREGAPIAWRGEWKGKPYEDKGQILELRPRERLRYSHFSPLSGAPDVPESYHEVAISLSGHDGAVRVDLTQDNNKTQAATEESQRNWGLMLGGLKKAVEG
jgi:uncharacterized protein YndB with AHSA1/START domain